MRLGKINLMCCQCSLTNRKSSLTKYYDPLRGERHVPWIAKVFKQFNGQIKRTLRTIIGDMF